MLVLFVARTYVRLVVFSRSVRRSVSVSSRRWHLAARVRVRSQVDWCSCAGTLIEQRHKTVAPRQTRKATREVRGHTRVRTIMMNHASSSVPPPWSCRARWGRSDWPRDASDECPKRALLRGGGGRSGWTTQALDTLSPSPPSFLSSTRRARAQEGRRRRDQTIGVEQVRRAGEGVPLVGHHCALGRAFFILCARPPPPLSLAHIVCSSSGFSSSLTLTSGVLSPIPCTSRV